MRIRLIMVYSAMKLLNLRLIVHDRIGVHFRCGDDEVPIKLLAQ